MNYFIHSNRTWKFERLTCFLQLKINILENRLLSQKIRSTLTKLSRKNISLFCKIDFAIWGNNRPVYWPINKKIRCQSTKNELYSRSSKEPRTTSNGTDITHSLHKKKNYWITLGDPLEACRNSRKQETTIQMGRRASFNYGRKLRASNKMYQKRA